MIPVRIGAWLLPCLVVLAAAIGGRAALAEPRELRVAVSSAQVVQFPTPARSVFIADPSIADVQVSAPTSVIVFGRKPGETTLIAIGEDDKTLAKIQIIVGYNYADLQRMILRDVPKADVKVSPTPTGVILSGTVPDEDTAEKVRATAQRYVADKDQIVNGLRVAGPAQVNLRVRVAEMSRSVTKQLGFNWETLAHAGSFVFGLSTGRIFLSPGSVAGLATINRAPPLTGLTSAVSPGAIFGALNTSRASVNTLIDALAEEGIVTVLAQPNLTAESGQTASFLAGGEFPIPVAQTNSGGGTPTITVAFKQFGVRLDFVPTVLSEDRISIKVRPEVSELTTIGAVTLPGDLVIPALNVRRAETTIRLGSGESFAIAGMIRNSNASDINKYPGLGDLPVIGPLFRSSQFQHNETELVIIVTPYVVRPVADGSSLKLPTDNNAPASDLEQILMDRLTARPVPGAANAIGPTGVRLLGDSGFIYQ